MPRLTRRKLLGISVGGLLSLFSFYAYENQYKNLIVEIIEDRLGYLNLSEIDLFEFADAFAEDRGTYGLRGHLLALAYPIEHASSLGLELEDQEEFEYKVLSRFLLSTDFFAHGTDDSRAVHYVAYSNPYRRPCSNPFARFD
jgi:hypothetical protein